MKAISGYLGEIVNRSRERLLRAGSAFIVLLLALVVFHVLLHPDAVLFCTDDNIGAMAQRKAMLPAVFLRGWNDRIFIGVRESVMPGWTNLLLWALPLRIFHNWIHALDLALASLFLMAFLRRRGLGWGTSWAGALAAFWVGSNFTLTYAGHIGKFGILLFAALGLWLTEIAASEERIRAGAWSLLAGGAWGAMFLEQADVALFFAASLGAYAPWRIYRLHGLSRAAWLRRFAPMLASAGLIALHPLWTGYEASVQGVAVEEGGQEAKWQFVTQWSWPPEETIDFVAPGFMGWRTGEPAGPYWGRMGRSAEWETRQEGFLNFKLENQYIGVIPLLLAAWAVAVASKTSRTAGVARDDVRDGGRDWNVDTRFWAVIALATFLLALGKFTPLYRIVMHLPAFSSVRAPVKWLQPFQIAIGILAACGLDAYQIAWRPDARAQFRSPLILTCALAAGVLLLMVSLRAALPQMESRWGAEWGPWTRNISALAWTALGRGAVWAAVGFLLFAVPLVFVREHFRSMFPPLGVAVCLLILVLDAVHLSRHYVYRLPLSAIASNDATRLIQRHIGSDRVALLTQEGPYGQWLTFLFPYEGLRTLNFTQMPRMPTDARRFLERVSSQPLAYWRLAGATLVMTPGALWRRLQTDPAWGETFDQIGSFRFVGASDGGFTVESADPSDADAQLLLRARVPAARFRLVSRWRPADDDAALAWIAEGARTAAEEALVAAEHFAPPSRTAGAAEGTIEVRTLRLGQTVLRVRTHVPVLLRVADYYDRHWRATLNGKAVAVARVDYMFMGVFVPPGEHDVRLTYRPPAWSLGGVALGILACVGAVVALSRRPSVERVSK